MNAAHQWGRLGLVAVVIGLGGLLTAGPWAATSVQQPARFPQHVLLIRHAEKPDDDTDIHLTSRGAARAAALPSLFVIPPTFPTKPAALPTPDFLFAAKASKHSNRSVETLTPLAAALKGLKIHAKHKDEDFQAVVQEVFTDPKYAGKTVLICWHHGNLAEFAQVVLARAANADKIKEQLPRHWKDAIFDRVWHFTFDDQGSVTFVNRPQRLLFEDSAK
jgi:hypothetical protein